MKTLTHSNYSNFFFHDVGGTNVCQNLCMFSKMPPNGGQKWPFILIAQVGGAKMPWWKTFRLAHRLGRKCLSDEKKRRSRDCSTSHCLPRIRVGHLLFFVLVMIDLCPFSFFPILANLTQNRIEISSYELWSEEGSGFHIPYKRRKHDTKWRAKRTSAATDVLWAVVSQQYEPGWQPKRMLIRY